MAVGTIQVIFWLGVAFVLILTYWMSRRLKLRWWPAGAIRLVLLVLILAAILDAAGGLVKDKIPTPEILIVDQSASLPENLRDQFRQDAITWLNANPDRVVIAYGSTAVISGPEGWSEVNDRTSKLDEAFALASKVLAGNQGKIILASDGMVASLGQTEEQIKSLSESGTVLDIIPLSPRSSSKDLFTGTIWAPSGVWEHTDFGIVLPLYAPQAGEAIISLIVNGELIEEYPAQVNPGENFVSISARSGAAGILTLELNVWWEGDTFPQNNISYASIKVFPSPRVLLVSKRESDIREFKRDLEDAGAVAQIFTPDRFPTDLSDLRDYDAIVLHDLLARDLSLEQTKAIEIFVNDWGKGLLILGGRNSYTLGGYSGTPLERLLPVSLEAPDRTEHAPATFIIVLDRSGSMLGDPSDIYSPIALTREAAMRAIENMRAEDYIGVLSFSGKIYWDVELRQLGDGLDLRAAQDAVSQIEASGGTFMYQALEEAINVLITNRPTQSLHILLMSDGVSADGSTAEFRALASYAHSQGITISTIALIAPGEESDPETLELIADVGQGRFYEVSDPSDLPKIMVSESAAAHSEYIQSGQTNFLLGEPNHPILAGFSLDELPLIIGYNSVTSKNKYGAEDILLSANFRDPILSAWQVGLGRVVVWMSDIGEEWAKLWKWWDRQGEFWIRVIRYSIPDPSLGLGQASISIEGEIVSVDLIVYSSSGIPVNLLLPEFQYLGLDGTLYKYPLAQVAPGKYHVDFPLPQEGAFRGVVLFEYQGQVEEVPAPFVVDYPVEWQPFDPSVGVNNLERWAQMTGGAQVDLFQGSVGQINRLEEPTNFNRLTVILFILIISWPLEIAIRRRWMPWR